MLLVSTVAIQQQVVRLATRLLLLAEIAHQVNGAVGFTHGHVLRPRGAMISANESRWSLKLGKAIMMTARGRCSLRGATTEHGRRLPVRENRRG
jgi:hypothetical protein